MSTRVAPSETPVFQRDLFDLFSSACGCHTDGSQGGFHVGLLDFPDQIDQSVLDRIASPDKNNDNNNEVMPPFGKLLSERTPDDPIVQLSSLLKEWIAQGKKQVLYLEPAATSGGPSPYLLTKAVGEGMTNIGDCIPDKALVASETEKSAALDTFFAGLTKAPSGTSAAQLGLPTNLSDTDLFTLDTETLARHGVIGYAPTYPLWSDDARKLRYVRVPRGQSIRFDKASQSFDIPDNTRFYKTFLKGVIEKDGQVHYRKMETRLIVARRNGSKRPDGTFDVNALFGTYEWNPDETEATLLTEQLNDESPFRDHMTTYFPDEVAAGAIQKKWAQDPTRLAYELGQAHATRSYAIPGRDRCIECHMGSPAGNFALGFLPAQVKRRPVGEGGVIEPSGPDELTQLERLIDYGVITGMNSPSDVAPLEKLEGSRPPRNDYELVAQGYMLGNCAHCHNPNGYPSVKNPVLAPILNFLPGPDSGIFQFPLDDPNKSFSPRIFRGADQSVPIPYITPSLADLPVDPGPDFYTRKADSDDSVNLTWIVLAPWRSLIYRNVDTPFTYSDDFALFPHMPMNAPGFDCRAPRILGDWMVSIPAVRTSKDTSEFALYYSDAVSGAATVDANPQPYTEVKPALPNGTPNPDYDYAVAVANARLSEYHAGLDYGAGAYSRYTFCPDTRDIVDPAVEQNPDFHPVPTAGDVNTGTPPRLVMPGVGVPIHAHWVVTDLTVSPGPWVPRREDWDDILVKGAFPEIAPDDPEAALKTIAQAKEKTVVQILQGITLTADFKSFALGEVPYGLWKPETGCTFPSVPSVGQLPDPKPAWVTNVKPAPASPVYMQAPGQAVFDLICINCHGPNADGQGRQADTLLLMTGGQTRVANLRDGLFGPASAPGDNRQRIFGTDPSAGSFDDFGARYVAWMGLGGTQRVIPASVLAVVSNTQVLGQKRKWPQTAVDANMLATAKNLCAEVSPSRTTVAFDPLSHTFELSPAFIQAAGKPTNGDAELWQSLCTKDNPHPLVALYSGWQTTTDPGLGSLNAGYFFSRDGYPSDAPVGDHLGHVVTGITADNRIPWCLRMPLDPKKVANATEFANDPANAIDGQPWPFCPSSVVPAGDSSSDSYAHLTDDDLERWRTRGAINAGLSVFVYLDQLARGLVTPKPPYDHCEQLDAK